MWELTPVAGDPGLLVLLVRAPAWKTPATRSPLPKHRCNWMLPGEHRLHAVPFVIHSCAFSNYYLPEGSTVPVFPRCVFRGESQWGGC